MKVKVESFLSTSVSSLITDEKPLIWIFGYGSLLWFPGFEHDGSYKGSLPGFSRRFYQGNVTFRGTPEKPGRVVTLIESQQEETIGLLFKVSGWSMILECLEHLYLREVENGYAFRVVSVKNCQTGEMVQALTCIALKNNPYFLGSEENRSEIAEQIATCSGTGGPNRDYLLKLAVSVRNLFPEVVDDHLFELEQLVLSM